MAPICTGNSGSMSCILDLREISLKKGSFSPQRHQLPVDEVDPVGEEEADVEGGEDAEEEEVEPGHLHFVLRMKVF